MKISLLNSITIKNRIKTYNLKTKLVKVLPYVGIVLILLFFEIISDGRLLTVANGSVIISQVFSIAIGAAGMIFVISQGNLDFSMGAIVGIVAVVAALVSHYSLFLTLPVSLLLGALIGVINGFTNSVLKIPSFIATIGISFILKGITYILLDSGSIGASFYLGKYDTIFIKTIVLLIIMVIGFIVFEYSKFGKRSRAIGSNIQAAKQCGVNIIKSKILAYVFSGLSCGLVAFFSIVKSFTASTSTGVNFEVDVLIALMLGGLPITGGCNSRFRNVIIGSSIMALVSNGMTLWGIDNFNQQLIRGVIFILAVIVSFDRKNITVIK
ncbi:ABC transporter permease [Halocella sp. SP3-1]|uniref:ABC transporter permease n=1 Tax=Halocella sp. SP3-1 TaxID=2382161 RepID=UPI000F7637CA|nr:ABC transporter permease [Halocella sp. SP3-1]AZO96272.1 ABC transporter permease [Halocella sp. SP3-1]